MKKLLAAAVPLLFLGACTPSTSAPGNDLTLNDRMKNPLFAERYYDDLVEQMASYIIQKDPILEDARMKNIIEDAREDGLKKANNANDLQNQGRKGVIMSDGDDAVGEVLVLNGSLFLGTDFETAPGPGLHLYLTTMNDPRVSSGTTMAFPDKTSVDIGAIHTPYGAQVYTLPEASKDDVKLSTFVLYDTVLKKIYGFAQLSKR